MKKYLEPSIELYELTVADVITTSGDGSDAGTGGMSPSGPDFS